MTEQQNDAQAAAAARAQHYAPTDPPVNRGAPMGDLQERSAVGDFLYQAATSGVGEVGAVGLVAGAAVVWDKVTGGGDQPQGKHQADD